MNSKTGNKAAALVLTACVLLITENCSLLTPKTAQDIPVTSNPLGARIIVDGKAAGQTPLLLTLKKNKNHTVRIEKDGYDPTELRVTRKLTARLAFETLAVPITAVGTGLVVFLFQLIATDAEKSFAEYNRTFTKICWITGAAGAALVIGETAAGANSVLSPKTLDVPLTKIEGPRPSLVNVISLDSEQFEGIRWIRIR